MHFAVVLQFHSRVDVGYESAGGDWLAHLQAEPESLLLNVHLTVLCHVDELGRR
jgi:hypothetical protein